MITSSPQGSLWSELVFLFWKLSPSVYRIQGFIFTLPFTDEVRSLSFYRSLILNYSWFPRLPHCSWKGWRTNASHTLHSEVKWSRSVPSDSVTPWTVAHHAPLSMGFSRQEYWSGLPFPFPGDLPDPGIEPRSPRLQAEALTSVPPGKPLNFIASLNQHEITNFLKWYFNLVTVRMFSGNILS